jgi:hypothetical protein
LEVVVDQNTVDNSRRGFNSWIAMAMSGLVSGLMGLARESEAGEQPPPPTEGNAAQPPAAENRQDRAKKKKQPDSSNLLLSEPHVCRGLNTCKGKGADGRNACAGQGVCATAPHHMCKGNNECRGLGACEEGTWPQHQPEYPGENTCKGKGGCEVPMYPNRARMWIKARNRFGAIMADMGKSIGYPPRDPRAR